MRHPVDRGPGHRSPLEAFARFGRRHARQLPHLWIEEYVGWLTRGLPGPEGVFFRWLLYRPLFRRLPFVPLIYPGVYFTHTYGISVGRNFSVNTGALLDGRGGITIGDSVMIGPQTVVVSSHHQSDVPTIPMASLDHVLAPVVIEDDVWIGAHVFIKGGVRIGRGAVVAAGAVVTRDVEPYAVVAGVPAARVRSRKPPDAVG